uniref:Uncharacterized protein n=1 Tax=Meloidogyne incognita TaxID=6306 RepID=A0A914MAZ0_MELIC
MPNISKSNNFNLNQLLIITSLLLVNITIFISANYDETNIESNLAEIKQLCQQFPNLAECRILSPPVQMEKRKSAYMRLGKRKSAYMRFGKRGVNEANQIPDSEYISIDGLMAENQPMEKRKSAYMRFGKRKSAYMRLG